VWKTPFATTSKTDTQTDSTICWPTSSQRVRQYHCSLFLYSLKVCTLVKETDCSSYSLINCHHKVYVGYSSLNCTTRLITTTESCGLSKKDVNNICCSGKYSTTKIFLSATAHWHMTTIMLHNLKRFSYTTDSKILP